MNSYEYYQDQFDVANDYATNSTGDASSQGLWRFRSRFQEDLCPITSMNYDPEHDLLWVGSSGGRVTSYIVKESSRYSSYLTSSAPVSELLVLNKSILSISGDSVRLHTDGGLPMARFTLEQAAIDNSQVFTCGMYVKQFGGVVSSTEVTPTHLVVGSSHEKAYVYDLSIPNRPIMEYVLGPPSICNKSNGIYNMIGGGDGRIRLLDGRLRMQKICHTLDAHTGIVNSLEILKDEVTLLSCGMNGRPINPYDTTSPLTYSSDPVVRVFDLRMLRQLSPIPIPLINTSFIRTIHNEPNPLVLFGATDGLIHTYDPLGDSNPADIFYASLGMEHSDPSVLMTAIVTSSSGQYLAVGSSDGTVTQFGKMLADDVEPAVNINSVDLQLPSVPTPSQVPLSMDSPVFASAFVLRPKKFLHGHEEPLLSSFASTPSVLHSKFRTTSSRKISDALLNKTVQQDFIGTTTNPGFLPNSMIYGGTCVKDGQTVVAYSVTDPRVALKHQMSGGESSPYELIRESSASPGVDGPPVCYRRVQSFRGRKRKMQFDYDSLNPVGVVCLENCVSNSYTNPILQVLFLLPEIRQAALLSQSSPYHHQDQLNSNPTLLCELGFLFHMMSMVQNESKDVPKVVTASNFQRAFQQCPEAVALGLLESSNTEEKVNDLLNMSQVFVRFLLHQLQKESELEVSRSSSSSSSSSSSRNTNPNLHEQNPIENIFGYETCCSNHFKPEIDPKGLAKARSRVKAVTLELFYPTISSGISKKNPNISKAAEFTSFSAILWHSLRREASMRGWCSTTDRYEALRQRRSVDVATISSILTVTCGDTVKDSTSVAGEAAVVDRLKQYWQQKNVLGGPWLPDEIEIWQIGRPDALHEMGKVVVSARLRGPNGEDPSTEEEKWLAFDGFTEAVINKPAATLMAGQVPMTDDQNTVIRMKLFGVVSQVPDGDSEGGCSTSSQDHSNHLVLHIQRNLSKFKQTTKTSSLGGGGEPLESVSSATKSDEELAEWILINDLVTQPASIHDVFHFYPWKLPSILFFKKVGYNFADDIPGSKSSTTTIISVPPSVFQLKSLSSTPCALGNITYLPSQGGLVAFDAEFVTVELEKVTLDSLGQRLDNEDRRQILARISLIDGSDLNAENPRVLADDCVLPSEPVVDYVTRFSGITEEDLSPSHSRFSLVSHRTAYLKLRCLVDRGCVIVGHGLTKDFDTANIFVPPKQIRDTVELWRLPQQRKISLRFLASYLLNMTIQDEVHDSVEDAKTALALYRHYLELAAKGPEYVAGIPYGMAVINELYSYGARTNWTIGLERLNPSSDSNF